MFFVCFIKSDIFHFNLSVSHVYIKNIFYAIFYLDLLIKFFFSIMFMWFPCGICLGRSCVKKVMCFFPGPESYEMRYSDWPNEWSEIQKVRNTDLAECYKLHKMWKYRQTKENINKLFTKHTRPVLGIYCPQSRLRATFS